MTYYNEHQRTVGHAEDCLWDVWKALPEDDPRKATLEKMLVDLSDLYHSFTEETA
jgi:hypothetical protein